MEGDTAEDWQFGSGAASLNGTATFMVLPLLCSSRKGAPDRHTRGKP